MTAWMPGDVSGGTVLTSADHLYNTHINELRTASDTNGAAIIGTASALEGEIAGTASYLQTQINNFGNTGNIKFSGTSFTETLTLQAFGDSIKGIGINPFKYFPAFYNCIADDTYSI